MASLSEELKRERELRGITLKQIADETKISVRFLEAVENDRLEAIPGEFYRRSYLRAYARYLGLDENRAVNTYSYRQTNDPAKSSKEETESNGSHLDALRWVAVGAAILTGAALIWTVGKSSSDDSSATAAPVQAAPAPLPAASRSEPLTPFPAQMSETSAEEAPLKLVLWIDDACWLEIKADGEVVTEGLKPQGFEQEIVARDEIRLWLGNAGGITYSINDQPGRALGQPGQVRKDVQITRENFREFVASNGMRNED